MTYKHRNITIQIELTDEDTFANGSKDIEISGARVACRYEHISGITGTQLAAYIYGLDRETMSVISGTGMVANTSKGRKIKVIYGDEACFYGVIIYATPDFNAVPEPYIQLVASPTIEARIKAFGGFTHNGSISSKEAFASISEFLGITLEYDADEKEFISPYYTGSVFTCVHQMCIDLNLKHEITLDTLKIWDESSNLNNQTLVISKDNGLIGFPRWDLIGFTVTAEFSTLFSVGRKINLITDVPNASGTFQILKVVNDISANLVGGLNQSTLVLTPIGQMT